MKKLQLFDQNHGLYPLQKCQFCGFLKAIFLLFKNACLLYKTSKIVFSRSIFTIYDMGIQGVTKDYRNLFLTRTFPDTFSWSILHKKSKLKKSQIFDLNDGLTPLEKF